MASYPDVVKFEEEKPSRNIIRLVKSGEFYRAYNHSAWLFQCCIAEHKVMRKYVKALKADVYYVGFPAKSLFNNIGERSSTKTDFGFDIELTADEQPDEEGFETWKVTIQTEPSSKGDFHSSQLFSNIYMNRFDQYVKRELHCRHYGRYVDDAYIVSGDRGYLRALIPAITHFLKEELGLEVSVGKTSIRDARHGVEFLGAYVKPFRTYVSTASLKRIKRGMKRLATADLGHLQSAANSYLGVLSHYNSYCLRRVLFGYLSHWDTCGRFTPDWLRFSPA